MKAVEPGVTRIRPLGDSGRHEAVAGPKRLLIDLNSLRASGYLPEAENDRKFADQYRQIKRPLVKKALPNSAQPTPEEFRLIMVTSALPGDGKTFTSINLALSLARERDVSVLLLDADLPKPHVSRIFGVKESPGLTDALTDEALSPETVVMETNIRGLSIMPAGLPVEGAAELLGSERMRQILKILCANNPRRLIVLDSPPLLVTSEGRTLLTVTGQVVLVVRAGVTPRQAVLDAIGLFDEHQAGGIVLNEAKVGIMQGYYGYGTYGSYGTYGNDGDANSPKI